MAEKEQGTNFGLNNDDFTFMDHYVDPSWSTIVDPVQTGADENIFAGLPDFTKDSIFMEPLPFDLGSFVTSMSTENPSMSTKDIFAPISSQAPLQGTIDPSATNLEPSLGAFSDSASPADSHSPSQSASAHADDAQSDSDEDSDDATDEFIAPKRASAARGRGISASVKSKRAANKPKPYPRVSDVVRDAPHKLMGADGKRQPASTELKGSVRSVDAADDDWRPTLEEYQKMSSKEKRQLRNKISARNFRVRRKEYITTLEGEVAIRDKQLETYREELTSTKSENTELRKEIERLKREIMEGRGGASIFEQPPVDSKAVLAQVNGKATRSTNTITPRPTRNKDLPASGSTRGFWGGATMNGTTPVHTTLIPDFDIATLSGKPRLLQENLNPLLNAAFKRDSLNQSNATSNMPLLSSGLDGLHNFTFKGMDGDRMQLWSKMAREAGAAQAQREKLLASPASSTDSSIGSSAYSYSSALSQSHVNPLFFSSAIKKDNKIVPMPTTTQAILATSISQNISGKLMTALWGAFAPKSTLDLDKVKKVLEGKAELRVVDVERSPAAVLEESLKAMSLAGTPSSSSAVASRKSSIDALEDGLKGMSIGSTSALKKEGSSPVGLFGRPMRTGHSPTPAHQTNNKHTVTAQH
ncbi:hypothetical protein FRC17_002077 [Serendipita sp. 399]|nr:hypothetical protein FRC17_002077 [Serendipita sp. 399]